LGFSGRQVIAAFRTVWQTNPKAKFSQPAGAAGLVRDRTILPMFQLEILPSAP
jgi:hypothetical protein